MFLIDYTRFNACKNFRMAMSSEIQSQLSKRSALAFGGNMIVKGNVGGGGTTAVFKHQLSPSSSIEVIGALGLQSLLEVRASRLVI